MTIGGVNGSLLTGSEAVQSAQYKGEISHFEDLVNSMKSSPKASGDGIVSSSQINNDKLTGDFASDFSNAYVSESDKHARPRGAAVNQSGAHGETRTIDKTSRLYEKSLELETFMVKMMLSSMRKTVNKSNLLGGDNFASNMYEDMMYDEYATQLTKNAGFGLADQMYLQLNKQA
ncbi:MAG TPA: flagellar biosynthesis protein FlgJ [Treponema sp.]|nr:flagellar biosynthesis protein FlgJ [Treponema sp.]